MNILALSARLPYPLDTGAKIRSFHVLKTLSEGHELTLLSFIGGTDEYVHIESLKKLGITVEPVLNPLVDKGISPFTILKCALSSNPITVEKYASRAFKSAYECLLHQHFDLIHCEHLHMAHYISPRLPQLKTFDAHNVESEIVQRLQTQEAKLFKKLVLTWHRKKMQRYEQENLRKFDLVLAVSDRDKENLAALSGIQNTRILENGVDIDYFSPAHHASSNNIVFVGSMDWWPNDDGIQSFIVKTFPLILAQNPGVRFFIVGRKPSKELLNIAEQHENIEVTGAVDDVRPFIENAAVYVVPLRVGGGTRLKVLEAFAMGKAIVSTSMGSEGITYTHGQDILIEDEPVLFANAVLRLLDDSKLRRFLGTNAIALATNYSWKTIGIKLQKLYDELTES